MKIRYIVVLSVLILGGIGFAVASSSDLQGRFTGAGGRSTGTTGLEVGAEVRGGGWKSSTSTKGSGPLGGSSTREYDSRIARLSATVDTLSEDFNDWVLTETYTRSAIGALESYADYEEYKELTISVAESGQALEAEFEAFFTEFESIDESRLSTSGATSFNDLENKIESVVYNVYTFEDVYTTLLPNFINDIYNFADRFARLGDLEILSIDASVGTDGRLYFTFSVINNSVHGSYSALSMPVGDIDLEGEYWVEGSSKSYFGMTISHDGELEPDVSTTVTGSLDIESRTSAIYEAFLEGGGPIYFDVTGFIASSGEVKEADRSNNAYKEAGSAL